MMNFTASEVVLLYLKLGMGRETNSLFVMSLSFAHVVFFFLPKITIPTGLKSQNGTESYSRTIFRVDLAFCRINKEAAIIYYLFFFFCCCSLRTFMRFYNKTCF